MVEQYIDTINVGGTDYEIGCNCGKPVYSDDTGDYGFVYRLTAEGEGLHKENATIKKFVGNSLVWNQLVPNGDMRDITSPISTYFRHNTPNTALSYENGYLKLLRNIEQAGVVASGTLGHVIAGHVYYLSADIVADGNIQFFYRIGGKSGTIMSNLQSSRVSDIITSTGDGPAVATFYNKTEGYIKNWQIIDLTLMFGSGKEPATVAEFEKLLTEPYYAYNAGTLINNRTKAIETVGFNLWDEEWEVGYFYDATNGVKVQSSNHATVKNLISVFPDTYYFLHATSSDSNNIFIIFFDKTDNYVRYTSVSVSGGQFKTPVNAYKIAFNVSKTFADNSNNICINISDSTRNGTYEPYKKSILPINLNSFRVKDSNGNVLTIEGGLKSAGSVYDEIDGNRYIKRIGSVDLGSLEWAYYSMRDYPHAFKSELPNLKSMANSITNGGYTQATYWPGGALTVNNNYFLGEKGIYLCRLDCDVPADMNSIVSGVTLYYELATPEVYELVDIIPNNYPVDDLGTEARIAPLDNSGVPGAPFKGDIDYYRSSDSYLHTVIVNGELARVENGTAEINLPDAQLKLKVGESITPIFSSNATEDVRIELEAGDNVTLTPDFTAGKVTITAAVNTADLKIKAGTNGTAVTVFNADASSDSTIELGAGSSTDWDVNFAINSSKKITGTVVHPTIPTITLNGSSSTSPSFYAPTSAGTSGQALISSGSGAPTWGTVSTSDELVKQTVVTSSSHPLLASSASSPSSGNTYSAVYASDVLLTFYNNVGRINSAGGFYQTSDIRKKDIVSDLSLEKAYDLIDKCQTIVYTLKDRNQEQLGLIAQEVKEFFPEIVSEDENGYLSLDYSRLTVVILKVLKDLINRVSKLENYGNNN